MKIIALGDAMGRMGREAVKACLPALKEKHQPDLVILNAENIAHGTGVTPATLREMIDAGVDFFTSGNHIFKSRGYWDVLADPQLRDRVIRPANYPVGAPGEGAKLVTVGTRRVLVMNLLGRVMLRDTPDDPFRAFDAVLKEFAPLKPDAVLVDFHAEATSEKQAFGWHADGRASVVWGTHTHVATADHRLLKQGTAYITDLGFCGTRDSVIGADIEPVLQHFRSALPLQLEITRQDNAEIWGILAEIDSSGHAVAITPLHETTEIC